MGRLQARPHPMGHLAGDDGEVAPGAYDPEQDTWELYHLPDDFSQAKDLAAEQPEKPPN